MRKCWLTLGVISIVLGTILGLYVANKRFPEAWARFNQQVAVNGRQ
ncbi:MAG: hypothetical protein KBD55_03165 [Candidatus Pacebacteria bacterium]|nr:hypothetical protein [Candidatus Paceibacterota bacterium]